MKYLELTREEIHIFKILVENPTKTNEEIGAELIRSPHTIAAHVRSILSKLDLKSRYELLPYALKNGLYAVKGKNEGTSGEWSGI
jgi:DNA-binding CsgD family transcriptional regulator